MKTIKFKPDKPLSKQSQEVKELFNKAA